MGESVMRGIRGATSVERDEAELIREVTRELLEEILRRNRIVPEDIVSVIFTATADLASEFPAHAARDLGWRDVPLLCAAEIPVPGSLPRCVRVLMHVTSPLKRDEIEHVYLRGTSVLRPDLHGI